MDNFQGATHVPAQTADFTAIYQRNQAIYNALVQMKGAAENQHYMMFAHEANYQPRLINRLQAIYHKLLVTYEDMALIDEEGAIEVTVRSRSKSMTVAVNYDTGHAITEALVELLADEMLDVANRIVAARESMAEAKFDGDPNRVRYQEWLLDPVALLSLNTNPVDVGKYLERMDSTDRMPEAVSDAGGSSNQAGQGE